MSYTIMWFCIKSKDFERLIKTLNDSMQRVSDYMKTSIRTIKKYLEYVGNTLRYDYNNGVLEGINNKIKVIKRIAFGFKCFYHLQWAGIQFILV